MGIAATKVTLKYIDDNPKLSGHNVLATLNRTMQRSAVDPHSGSRVIVSISPYDSNNGVIV